MAWGNDNAEALFRETSRWRLGEISTGEFVSRVRAAGYSSSAIANVLARAWSSEPPLQGTEVTYRVLDVLLQLRMTEEHVQAQEDMSRSAGWLAFAALAVTVMGLVSTCQDARVRAAAERSTSAPAETSSPEPARRP